MTEIKICGRSCIIAKDSDVGYYNNMVEYCIYLIRELVARGAQVILEGPMCSTMWLLPSVRMLVGSSGFHLVRSDHCMSGAPYVRETLFLSTTDCILLLGKVCSHPRPHPETAGATGQSRMNTPLPQPLCIVLHGSRRPAA